MKEKLKISILTPTYNREKLLPNLYNSLIINSKFNLDIEWIIMDDGSTDNTKQLIENYMKEQKIEIRYFTQKNQGKMAAINNIVEKATGDLIIECDSDDYFTSSAFEVIKNAYNKYIQEKNVYALCFLKYDQKGKNMGNIFRNEKTTMFDLYFKEGETGEKALVFFTNVRKKYKYKIEKKEKFVTEARMYHEMDLNYKIICINEPIMICEYKEDGYTQNIKEQFCNNPYGYYEYFKEIFKQDLSGINFKKKLYIIKHFILFKHLTNSKNGLKYVKGFFYKLMYILLYIPGIIKTDKDFKN